ncbi:MAG: HEPN domain-containing protein [Salinibacter sp.]|uniref:HEPN domain-containing protein n=1 Tax=Salinibacter sp. TaxID=2065818 RepID=UPI0035D515FF
MSSENTPDPSGRPGPKDTIQALQEKAWSALSDAEVLSERGSPEATINRGCHTVFQAARAALLTEGESPDTHSGVIRPSATTSFGPNRDPWRLALSSPPRIDARRRRLGRGFGLQSSGGRRACREGPPVHGSC